MTVLTLVVLRLSCYEEKTAYVQIILAHKGFRTSFRIVRQREVQLIKDDKFKSADICTHFA